MIFDVKEIPESAAMKEVREWKRIRNEEVAGLPPHEAILRMMDLADERSREMIERMEQMKIAGTSPRLKTIS
ncbi:MAG: hypothetical protein NTX50_23745 [Candidatus Sumerlaeota bacterium]|nr:hypothetical protein [Candidatus Sumerlaeota bacterium]